MRPVASGITDKGLKRDNNEDWYFIDDEMGLYIVADGLGGHRAGEVASKTAVDVIKKSFSDWINARARAEDLYGEPDDTLSLKGNYILSSIRLANSVIYEMSNEHDEYRGMGTTVGVLVVDKDEIVSANVGDSRVYLIREGIIERLSRDHTLVEERLARGLMRPEEVDDFPYKHVLTRNLGSEKDVIPDVFEIDSLPGDRFVLCSDGLTDLVQDEEIRDYTLRASGPEEVCRNLLDLALERGGHDNTTIVSVFIPNEASKKGVLKRILGRIGAILKGR